MTTVRIAINKDIEKVLKTLKKTYPTLNEPEIFKLGLSKLTENENKFDDIPEITPHFRKRIKEAEESGYSRIFETAEEAIEDLFDEN